MAGYGIEVSLKIRVAKTRGNAKELDGSFGGNESVAAERGQLTHWNTVSGHDERLTLIEFDHDLSTVVPQLALTDLLTHTPSVAPCATLLCIQLWDRSG